MSGFTSFASAAASPTNPNYTLEVGGISSSGVLTSFTSGAANTAGSYGTLIASTAAAWAGFFLIPGSAATSTTRFMINIRIGGSTVILPDFYVRPATSVIDEIFIPLQVPVGSLVEANVRCSSATTAMGLGIQGIPASGAPFLGFTQATALNADTTNTRPSATDVPFASAAPSPFTQLVASTAAQYGALLAVLDGNATSPATTQDIFGVLATGASGSETQFAGRIPGRSSISSATVARTPHHLFERVVASGSRLSGTILCNTPGTDNGRIGLYGFA